MGAKESHDRADGYITACCSLSSDDDKHIIPPYGTTLKTLWEHRPKYITDRCDVIHSPSLVVRIFIVLLYYCTSDTIGITKKYHKKVSPHTQAARVALKRPVL